MNKKKKEDFIFVKGKRWKQNKMMGQQKKKRKMIYPAFFRFI